MDKPIRVAHFVGSMSLGGAETFIMNIYRKINRELVQFDFVCSKREKAYYDDEIKKLGGRIFYIDNPKMIGIYKSFKQIKKILANEKFDVVHSHIALYSGIVLMAAKYAKIPIRISHSHSAIVSNPKFIRKMYENTMRILIERYSTSKVSCGKLAAKYLYGNIGDVVILNNCIDLEKYKRIQETETIKLKERLNIDCKTLVIGHVGRFSEVKNHTFILKIAKILKERNVNFKIFLVGDGELKEQVEKEIVNNNLQENIVVLGIRKDIPEIMNIFDVFILPSLFEGFPLVILEAQAAGLPCVVSDTVSMEVELGFDLVKFASLDNINDWIDQILLFKDYSCKRKDIAEKMDNLGYDISYNVKKLYDIYSISGNGEIKEC